MYLKLISSVGIIFCTCFLGFYYSYKPFYRKKDILEMKRAIICLVSEIKLYSNLKEAIFNIQKNINCPIKIFFENFLYNLENKKGEELYILWEDAINNSEKHFFTNADIENFKMLGKIISNIDIDLNLDSIKIIIDYIDNEIKNIENEKMKLCKMYQSLGVLSGLMIIILLI